MKKYTLQFIAQLLARISSSRKKRSIVFLVTATLFFSLAGLSSIFYLRDIESEYNILTQQRTNRLVQLLSQIQSLDTTIHLAAKAKNSRVPASDLETNNKVADALLQRAHESKDIDFYVVQKNGEVIQSVNTGPLTEGQRQTLNHLNEVQIFETLTVATTQAGDVVVSAGFNRNWPEFRKRALFSVLEGAVVELAFIVALVAGLLIFFARDIMRLVKRLELGVNQYVDVKPVSRESDRIIKTLRNLEDRVVQMESSQQHFKNQLFSAITHELNSKKTPPYDFACTMARVDLNGFSELNRTMDPAHFRKVVDHLFVECMALVNRYGGFMSEYLGDEIIFYFKDQQWERSSLVAVGCITQMHKVARAVSEQYVSILPFALKFKSALSHGNLAVRKGARELEISGFPFIESVRILKEVKERDDFIIVTSPEVAHRLESYVPAASYTIADLKGIGSMEIFKLDLACDLHSVLESGRYEGLDRFRDTESLVYMVQWINKRLIQDDTFLFLKLRPLLTILMSIVVRPFSEQKLEMEAAKALDTITKKDPSNAVTSTFLSFIGRLVSPDVVSPALRALLSDVSRNSNPRVQANAIEAMGRLSLSQDIFPPGATEHNRVVANYMIATGTREFTKDLAQRLGGMLVSKSENVRASALYALGEIVEFHLKRNPVHFRSSQIFQKSMKEALRSLYDDNEMVRRQTLRMAAKIDDPTVSSEIERFRRELVDKALSDKAAAGRLTEVSNHYDSAA